MPRRGARTGWGAAAATLLVLVPVLAACSTPEPNRGARDDGQGSAATTAAPSDGGAGGGEGTASPGTRRDATLTGRILGPDGAPLAGAAVTVVEKGSTRGLDAALAAVFTLGIACVADPPTCDAGERVVDAATTDADGRYALTLPHAYLPGYETDEDWVLSVGRAPADGERTGPSSSFELEVNTAVQEAPDLALWDGSPSLVVEGSQARVRMPELSAGPDLQDAAPRFVDAGGGLLWTVVGEVVDLRVLEDRAAVLASAGRADVTVRHDDGRTIYHQRVATAAIPFTGTAVPASRAKPCALSTEALVGCWVTDGDLVTSSEVPPDATLTVDLGAPAEVGLVVLRGTTGLRGTPPRIEVSVDGAAWQALPARRLDGAAGWSAGARPGDGIPQVRYLRLRAPEALSLAEVSVWPPTESERLTAHPDAVGREGGGPADGDGLDDVPWALAVVAGALVLLVGAATLRGARRARV